MLGNFKKEDLRIKRTFRSLSEALPRLLKTRSFERITINDLCDEAQLSRSAFYAHFQDKFDLLSYCLSLIVPVVKGVIFEGTDQEINDLILEESKIITNLVEDATGETRGIIIKFFIIALEVPTNTDDDNLMLAHLCAGGLLNILEWQVKNKFPPATPPISPRFLRVLKGLISACKKQ